MSDPSINPWTRALRRSAGTLALLLVGSVTAFLGPQSVASSAVSSASGQGVIAVVGQEKLRENDLVAADPPAFADLETDYRRQQRQLELKFAKARHDLLQKQLDKLLDGQALELEAKARRVPTAEVLAELKLAVPTEDEMRSFYEANKERIRQPYEAVVPKVREYLSNQQNQSATRQFYETLRVKHGIRATLDAYRVPVAASGPVRGKSSATVTIVEFGDFQCPYCKEAESSLRTILDRHPDDVRVVFRNLPLTQIHPNAKNAAEAAVCADRQGKFWEMHDAMYEDQSALSADSLQATATRLGLDRASFATCVKDGAAARSLEIDGKAALELGLDGTPYFFINGRPLDGDVPVEKFEHVIAEELHRPEPG
jgi:protein-disulfide isomerase